MIFAKDKPGLAKHLKDIPGSDKPIRITLQKADDQEEDLDP